MQPDTTRMRLTFLAIYHRMVALPEKRRRYAFARAVRLDAFSRFRLRRRLDEFEAKLPAYIEMHVALARRLGRAHLCRISPAWLRAEVALRAALRSAYLPYAGALPAPPPRGPAFRRLVYSVCWVGAFAGSALALLFGLLVLTNLVAFIDTAVMARA